MFNRKKFNEMKDNTEKYRFTGEHPYHKAPKKEDMEFLKKSKKESLIYPVIFGLIFAPTCYIFVHRASFPMFFQNPLRERTPRLTNQVKKFKNHFAWTMILGFLSLSFFGAQVRHFVSRYWLYQEYRYLADRYVVLKAERLLEDTIRENRENNYQ